MLWFWDIAINEWTDFERREFKKFATANERAPPGGLENEKLKIVLDRNQGTGRLPTAHACFNEFLMPGYPSKEVLREKLKYALAYNKGFGMV